MYVLSNPPVSIVYFFLMCKEMCCRVRFFCITQYMMRHAAMVKPWEALSLHYNL